MSFRIRNDNITISVTREVAARLSPSTLPGETNALHLLTARAALPQIRVEKLIGSQANYEIQIKISIYFKR